MNQSMCFAHRQKVLSVPSPDLK